MRHALRPALSAAEREAVHRAGVEHFNAGRYYEAHDAWERIWRSPDPEPADLFQGFIQVAVALHHHFDRGRPDTARRVLARARRRLAGRPLVELGLDLDRLRADVAAWEAWLGDASGEPPPNPRLSYRATVSPLSNPSQKVGGCSALSSRPESLPDAGPVTPGPGGAPTV